MLREFFLRFQEHINKNEMTFTTQVPKELSSFIEVLHEDGFIVGYRVLGKTTRDTNMVVTLAPEREGDETDFDFSDGLYRRYLRWRDIPNLNTSERRLANRSIANSHIVPMQIDFTQTTSRVASSEEWDRLNGRRIELILKQSEDELSRNEEEELKRIRSKMRTILKEIAPPPPNPQNH